MGVADAPGSSGDAYRAALAEQACRKGVTPITSTEELRADVFDTHAQLDEFLSDLRAFRHAHVA
jgi:tyrosine-protein phosphatase YwqE